MNGRKIGDLPHGGLRKWSKNSPNSLREGGCGVLGFGVRGIKLVFPGEYLTLLIGKIFSSLNSSCKKLYYTDIYMFYFLIMVINSLQPSELSSDSFFASKQFYLCTVENQDGIFFVLYPISFE